MTLEKLNIDITFCFYLCSILHHILEKRNFNIKHYLSFWFEIVVQNNTKQMNRKTDIFLSQKTFLISLKRAVLYKSYHICLGPLCKRPGPFSAPIEYLLLHFQFCMGMGIYRLWFYINYSQKFTHTIQQEVQKTIYKLAAILKKHFSAFTFT